MSNIQIPCLLVGRFLLGLYFILPGLQKIFQFEAMSQYMANHMENLSVPTISVLLVLTIILQIVLGLALIVGYQGRFSAFLLAGLTLVISIFMHGFWDLPEGSSVAHETQNFVKNMAIMAGLLIVAANGTGPLSLDSRQVKDNTV